MDCTIQRILGEHEGDEAPEAEQRPGPMEIVNATPDDAKVHELANLWTMGNKGEVVRRFMDMDNETSVKLVFVIGQEGALELARMVDQRVEQQPGDTESTEPERVEPASDHVKEIIGDPESAISGIHRPHVMPP